MYEKLPIIDRNGGLIGHVVLENDVQRAITDLPNGWVLRPLVDAKPSLYMFRMDAVPAHAIYGTEESNDG